MISSPGPMSRARKTSSIASVPLAQPMQCCVPEKLAECGFELLHEPVAVVANELAGGQYGLDGRVDLRHERSMLIEQVL